jgi:hypothetical protein
MLGVCKAYVSKRETGAVPFSDEYEARVRALCRDRARRPAMPADVALARFRLRAHVARARGAGKIGPYTWAELERRSGEGRQAMARAVAALLDEGALQRVAGALYAGEGELPDEAPPAVTYEHGRAVWA